MTKEEQALLQKWRDNRGISMEDFEDAMNALQKPCDDTVSIRKDVLKCRVGKLVVYNVEWLKKHWQMEMDIVCGIKPCDDAISRDAVRKLRKYVWVGGTQTVSLDDIDELPSVTPTSIECEDAISRDAVIRLIRNENSALNDIFVTHGAGEKLSKQINELPSVSTTKNIVNHGTMNITL